MTRPFELLAMGCLGFGLVGCAGGWEESGPLPGEQLPGQELQVGQEQDGLAAKGETGGLTKPGSNPAVRRLGPGEPCEGVLGACDIGLTCTDGVCCTSKCDGLCKRCDLELLPAELSEQPRYSGSCTVIEDCSECVRYVDG